MTVKELKQKIAKADDNMHVVAYCEEGAKTQFFEIEDASVARGTPRKSEAGKVGFTFDSTGPANWLFITVSKT